MLGLNLDYPLLLSTVIEHAARRRSATYRKLSRTNGMEKLRSDYRSVSRAQPPTGVCLAPHWRQKKAVVRWLTRVEHAPPISNCSTVCGSGIGAVLAHTANPPPAAGAGSLHDQHFTGYPNAVHPMHDTVALAEQLSPRLESVDRFIVMAGRDDMPAIPTLREDVQCYEDLVEAGEAGHRPGRNWTSAPPAHCASPPERPANRKACCEAAPWHRPVGAVHWRWQRLGVIGQRHCPGHPRILSLQHRLGGALPRRRCMAAEAACCRDAPG